MLNVFYVCYLEKLFRCLLEICRSSSVEAMSNVRFLPRGIIYANKKIGAIIRHTYTRSQLHIHKIWFTRCQAALRGLRSRFCFDWVC